jgi:antitoxin component YwqK of YwqJK toxin-antitoxin module
MKKILFTLFLICIVHSLVQAQSDFDWKEINKVDESGLKQGFWLEYEIDTLIKQWQAILIDSSGNDTIINYYIYQTGYYLNNKKDSIWRFYDTNRKTEGRNIIYGNLLYEAKYSNDCLKGMFKTFYLSGKLKSEINIENENANGIINVYFENETLYLTGEIIPDNEFFKGVEFNILGNKVQERMFNSEIVLKEWTDLHKLLKNNNK